MTPPPRLRREPPPFRPVTVVAAEAATGWLTRVTLQGEGIAAMEPHGVAASVRLLLPGADGPVLPEWNGNEWLLADGTRPAIRTLTPLERDGDRLDVLVVRHDGGPLSAWAGEASPGARAAVSGPGRDSAPTPNGAAYLIAGDEAAVPAIGQVLAHLQSAGTVTVMIETSHPDDPAPMPDRLDATVTWLARSGSPGEALVAAVEGFALPEGILVWAAGEAAAMHRIRRHLTASGVPRTHTTVRGYWKHGKASGAGGE